MGQHEIVARLLLREAQMAGGQPHPGVQPVKRADRLHVEAAEAVVARDMAELVKEHAVAALFARAERLWRQYDTRVDAAPCHRHDVAIGDPDSDVAAHAETD